MNYNAEAERLLRNYIHSGEDIQKLNTELNQTYQLKIQTQNTLKAAAITGMPHSTNVSDLTYKAVEMSIDRHDKHVEFIVGQIQNIYDEKELIHEAIKRLTMEEYRAVDLHFFKQYKPGKVAGIMHYGKSRVYELLKEGTSKVAWFLETVEKSGQKWKKSQNSVI
jgi:predicted DNA-binding protein (UPF0251 family)